MAITKTTTNVDTLKINYLTQEMYEDALENDEINDNELYLTPGISGPLICNSVYSSQVDNYVLDKTAQEIYDALLAGIPVYIKIQYGTPSDYDGSLCLMPVIKIFNYGPTNTQLFRICASKPSYIGSKDTYTLTYGPSVVIYQTSNINDYPVFYITIKTIDSYVGVESISF